MVILTLKTKQMRPEVKGLHSPDVFDLQAYVPEEPECFSLLLQIMAGVAGEDGEESFDVQVCTPMWLAQNHKQSEVVIGRHLLIVFEYDYARLVNLIHSYCNNCVGDTWDEVATKLGRLGKWEFEDYQA